MKSFRESAHRRPVGRAVRGPVRVAELAGPSDFPLAQVDPSRPPWPGRQLQVNGLDIQVRSTPSSNPDAEPALYVHGLGGASTNFTDFADLLSPWLSAEAIDLPGFGGSGPAPDGNYSIAAHTRVVISYLEQSGRGPVHLVGNSMGGAISIQLAASRPDLVRTLTLVSPAVPDLRPKKGSDALMPLLLLPGLGSRVLAKLDQSPAERRARAVVDLCFAHPELVPANRLAEAVEEIETRRGHPWAGEAFMSSLRGLVRTYLTAGSRSPWHALSQISAPSLVVWGQLDRLVDVANAPRVATTLQDATLLVLPEIGHTAQLEDPASTSRAVLALLARANDGNKQAGVGV
ncbi:alpha/beta fold hydrolase [Jatrophihabitans lederbergiae]|uniref:Alpha/beta hydrolase n=1 Tax=Jatrophihabitans lederbergiae TaxID=3075547 RepID=A0ABU2J729_9ACTN|nr:alpha/beta hydrolase [Jatrophihabitans sp. DSM 44399]MDT0260541.1 alpha/beta hydrolase [Jatrophihabitans sp. DSM 44399]